MTIESNSFADISLFFFAPSFKLETPHRVASILQLNYKEVRLLLAIDICVGYCIEYDAIVLQALHLPRFFQFSL